jgi:hypothetical protein
MASAVHATFAALPRAVAHTIFALLPVAARARCAAVCRSWRAALAERGAWLRLDLSHGNAPRALLDDTLFAALVARAGGQLQSLDVQYCTALSTEALLAVLSANAAALVEVRTTARLQLEAVEALARAAPRLRLFEVEVDRCNSAATAGRLLHNEAPFAALQVSRLEAELQGGDEADVPLLAAGMAAHVPLTELAIDGGPLGTAAALDALVDAALARRLSNLTLMDCHFPPAATASLVRLLEGDALTTLYIFDFHKRLIDETAAPALSNALRANSSLTSLTLCMVDFWRHPNASNELLGALTGHPSIRSLDISSNNSEGLDFWVDGAALGALIAANAPTLHELDVSCCFLGDDAMQPLMEALPLNTNLRKLCCGDNSMTAEFMREQLLPALRANTSLLELRAKNDSPAGQEDTRVVAQEAQTLVQHRLEGAADATR